jgi:hypothetical protein
MRHGNRNAQQKTRVTGHAAEIRQRVTRHPRPVGYLLSERLYADRVRLAMARTKKGSRVALCDLHARPRPTVFLVGDVALVLAEQAMV